MGLAISTVAFLAGSAALVSAGVPILFPPGQTPQFPVAAGGARTGQAILVPNRQIAGGSMRQPQESSAVLSSVQNNNGSLPAYYAPPSGSATPARQVNPRASQEWREEQAKKHFWLFTEKQDERSASDTTKAKFGVKEYTYEGIEGNAANLDPTFKGLSTFTRDANAADRAGTRFEPDPESPQPPASERFGAHSSPEISLADMLAPIASAASPSAESPAGLQKMLGNTGSEPRNGGLELNWLGNTRGSANPSGNRDVVNRSPDSSWQPLQPLVGDAGRSGRSAAMASPGSLNPGAASPSSFGRPVDASAPPSGGFNRGASRVTGFSSLPSPSFSAPREPPSWNGSRPPDPPRRRF